MAWTFPQRQNCKYKNSLCFTHPWLGKVIRHGRFFSVCCHHVSHDGISAHAEHQVAHSFNINQWQWLKWRLSTFKRSPVVFKCLPFICIFHSLFGHFTHKMTNGKNSMKIITTCSPTALYLQNRFLFIFYIYIFWIVHCLLPCLPCSSSSLPFLEVRYIS